MRGWHIIHPDHAPIVDPAVARVYAAMRPRTPGASYVNYCDLDLPDFARAYWGDNLGRLVAVKQQYDPDNLFHHARSVPVSLPVA
ncbi:BBE domain-containing protein [Bradyrhizobium sp.]|uniref:BBE domain-containing protein n=1 Tax=Bradyrhizobium sp. TaxID=376 RepID=UPI003C775886